MAILQAKKRLFIGDTNMLGVIDNIKSACELQHDHLKIVTVKYLPEFHVENNEKEFFVRYTED